MKALYDVTNPESVKDLLNSVNRTALVLPHFQRSFVWPLEKTRGLLDSIVAGFPAGAMLAMKVDSTNNDMLFRIRSFEEAPQLVPDRQEQLVLDGQQRLTSLYHALFGKGEYRHFLQLRPYIDTPATAEFDDCLLSLKVGNRKDKPLLDKYSSLAGQAEDLTLPLSVLMAASGGYVAWYLQVCTTLAEEPESALRQSLAELEETLVEPMLGYRFPWIVLKSDTPHEAVATVFDVVNNTGQRLSIFDLVVARTWEPGQPTIQDKWEDACQIVEETPSLLGDYGIDPVYALYVIALLTTASNGSGNDPSCSRGDVLDLKKRDVAAHWDNSVWGLNEALRVLRDDCGVLAKKWIPYEPALLPLAATLATTRCISGLDRGALRARLVRFFWCTCLSGEYDQGAVAKAARDFKLLVEWQKGGSVPAVVAGFDAVDLVDRLGDILPRNGAVYKALMCLSNSRQATDFLNLEPLTSVTVGSLKVDDHHVFPKAFLEQDLHITDAGRINTILNRTLIDAESNKSLGKTKPSSYFGAMKITHGDTKLDSLLSGHLLPSGQESPLFQDDFDTFVERRRSMFATAIVWATSGVDEAVPAADGEAPANEST